MLLQGVMEAGTVDDLQLGEHRITGKPVAEKLDKPLRFVTMRGFAMRKMDSGAGGIFSLGKSKAKICVQQETGVTFADIAGIDEAKEELMTVVEFLRTPERYRRIGGNIPKGV